MGDHGHVALGGMSSSDEVLHAFLCVPKRVDMGNHLKENRRLAGTPAADAVRFVARARTIDELSEVPSVVANDVCDIMGESVGASHINTCDEWRVGGAYTVEIVDVAPTVMALLGLPVPRHAVRHDRRLRKTR